MAKPLELRHELKFYITEGEYRVLRDRLFPALPLDENADPAHRQYHIRSLYFDDIYNSAVWEKQDGVEFRKKFRIRIYNLQDQFIKLEKKMKYNQYTAKDSVSLTREQCDAILEGDLSFIKLGTVPLLDEFYADTRSKLLRPAVLVDYYREAYIYPAGNVRITFDRELHSGQFSHDLFSGLTSTVPILDPGTLILEIKYDHFLPDHIQEILQTTKGLRSAVSKYVLCRRFH